MLEIIQHFGYLGVFVTIFGEISFMIFPLPGDTLLFATGILTNNGPLSYQKLILTAMIASVLAGHLGYYIGRRISKETLLDNRIYKVNPAHIKKTEDFFNKYGFYAILLSRFVPIVRNFISQLMGIIEYDRKKFFIANLGASIIWPFVIITMGHLLGEMFPNLITYAEYGMLAVLVILSSPIIYEFLKSKKH